MTESEIILTFSESLRQIATAQGLNGNALAKKCKISRRNAYRYLSMETLPRWEQLAKLATGLGCSVSELFGGG